jgi:hypothetical protein
MINKRVWLTEMSQSLGRPATLNGIADAEANKEVLSARHPVRHHLIH